jgi:hypothetical protein
MVGKRPAESGAMFKKSCGAFERCKLLAADRF